MKRVITKIINNKFIVSQNMPPVISLGSGLSLSRSLSGFGVDVYSTDSEFIVDRFSKRTSRPPWGWKTKYNERLLVELIKFSDKFHSKSVLIPTTDNAIEFIIKYYDELVKYYQVSGVFKPDIGNLFLFKKEFYKACKFYNIEYPATIFFESFDDLKKIKEELRFPILIKPNLIHKWKTFLKGNKIILINNISELYEIIKLPFELLRDSMFQEVIQGPETNIVLFKGCYDKDGNLIDYFTGRKIRQFPPHFGSASLAESKKIQEILYICDKMFSKIRIHGLIGAEYKYDQMDNKFKIIEINIRPQLWEDLMRIAGKNIIWNHYCDLIGKKRYIISEQVEGVKWVHINRDIFSALWYMSHNELNIIKWIKSYSNVKVDALMQFSDPGTIFGSLCYSINQIIKYKIKPIINNILRIINKGYL